MILIYKCTLVSYVSTNSGPALLNVGTTRRINSTGNCTQQEKIFNIIIELSRGTNFTGNIPMITLLCGIVHPVFDIIQFSGNSISVKFVVYVSSVTLIPGNSSITFLEGDQMIVKCVTSPSRPRPQIRWWVGNEIKTDNINESISNSGNLIIMESEITLMLNRSYRNRLLYCETQVPEQGTWISSSKSQINVWYPPSVPAVQAYSEGFPWLENRTGILECNISEPGNPAASVTWASTRGKKDGLGHLILENLTAIDNGLAVKCNLSNNFTVLMHLVVESLVRNLEVEYTPEITFVPSQTSVTIIETKDLLVTCNSRGNPTPSVEWLNKSQLSDILYIQNVSRHDSGTYICMANTRSTNYGRIPLQSQKQLNLTVHFAPEMSVKVTPSIVEVNSAVRIECSAHGQPSSYKFYDWIHKLGNNEVRHIKGILANQSTSGISFPSITIADMATYICLVDNGIIGPDGGIVQSMEAQINVIGPPYMVLRFYLNRVGDQIELHFDPGFNGDCIQIFVIQYKSETDLEDWKNASILQETETQYRLPNGTFAVNITKPFPGSYIYRMYSWNEIDRSPYSYEIKVLIPEVITPDSSSTFSLPAVAGGIGAGVVVILMAVAALFLWRRYHHHSQHTDGKQRNKSNAKSVRHDAASGQDYEGLHLNNTEASAYLHLNDITLEENRNANTRPPENDSYEKLHPYTNNDIQMYSSLKIPKISKDSEKVYENTRIKATDLTAEHQ